MKVTLNKTPSRHESFADNKYWFSIPKKVIEFIGKEVIVKKQKWGYILSKPNIDSTTSPIKFSASNALRITHALVNESEDLVEYLIDIDYESEEINLIKT